VSGIRHVWAGYVGLRGVKSENERLKRELEAVQVEVQQQRALADRTRSLERLLDLRDRANLTTTAAEIIAAGATPDFRTVTIDKGTRDGLRADMSVISPAGVVGRVVVPSARSAKVQLLVDRNAAAGALIERSRAQGVVVGGGEDRLQMDYVSEVADVVVGDLVVTSGIDGIYPKGFVIGKVDVVERSGGGFKRIMVRPAVDFRAIEEVLVVLTPTPAKEAGEGSE
jgi:rod shape-determining protein MreC